MRMTHESGSFLLRFFRKFLSNHNNLNYYSIVCVYAYLNFLLHAHTKFDKLSIAYSLLRERIYIRIVEGQAISPLNHDTDKSKRKGGNVT